MTTLKRIKLSPTLKFLIPYLDIVCLVCFDIAYKNVYTYSVNRIGHIYIARLLINILTGIFTVIYIGYLAYFFLYICTCYFLILKCKYTRSSPLSFGVVWNAPLFFNLSM